MYKVEVRRRAQRALDKLPKSDFQAVIEAIKGLAQTPRPRGIEKVKSTGLWRIRQGDYRIIYAIDDNERLALDMLGITVYLDGQNVEVTGVIEPEKQALRCTSNQNNVSNVTPIPFSFKVAVSVVK